MDLYCAKVKNKINFFFSNKWKSVYKEGVTQALPINDIKGFIGNYLDFH